MWKVSERCIPTSGLIADIPRSVALVVPQHCLLHLFPLYTNHFRGLAVPSNAHARS